MKASRPAWSKKNSVPAGNNLITLYFWAISALILVACSSGEASSPVPTQILIPPTETAVPVTPPATDTPPPAIRAIDVQSNIPPDIATLESEAERALVQAIFDDAVERAEADMSDIQLISVEGAEWSNATLLGCPSTSSDAEIPGYIVLLVIGDEVFEYHTDDTERIRLCNRADLREVEGNVLVQVDPIAADVLSMVQRRLAEQFDIPTRRVQLVSMNSIIWPDASLGCPLEDEVYEQVEIEGYRLVVSVAEEEYSFHAAFDRLIECDIGDEVLPTPEVEITPELTPEITAEATPEVTDEPEATPETG